MAARVTSVSLPEFSDLNARVQPGDFVDCYAVASKLSPRAAAEIITSFPGWVRMLVAFRGLLVAPFGLRRRGPDGANTLGPFPVENETRQEIIAGFDDRHLDFRVSIASNAGRVTLATWVHPHNFGGCAYLATILPFHILIARNALSRVVAAGAAGQTA